MSASTQLRKALTTTGDGANLLPYDLDPVLYEELLKLQPLAQLVSLIQAESKTHEYTVRTSHPSAWFEGESTPANPKNGGYQRKNVQVKIQRIWGSVTGFAQAMDERFINALATELEGSLEGVSNLMEFGTLFGAANDITFTGDAYQYSGILPRLYKYAPQNVIQGGGAKVSLDMLDQAIAASASFRGVQNDPRAWFMGVRMKQVVDGLQTRVQIPLTQVELADGKLVMAAYGRAGILESNYVKPEGVSAIDNFTATAAAGGALSNPVAYHYRIASVTMFGEQAAIAEATDTTGVGEGTIELAWDADPDAVQYMIFRATGTGDFGLIDIIPALTYDSAGTVNGTVETYTDAGARAEIAEVLPLEEGEEMIVLANLNPRRGVAHVGKIDDMGRPVDNLWSFVELARVKDTFDYMLRAFMTLRVIYPNLFSVIRNVRTSA
jgi:hypothetical protein